MKTIFVSVFPFGETDSEPRDLLDNSGHRIIYSPYAKKLKPEETAEFAADCDAIIAGTELLMPLIQTSSSLKFISRVGIGLDSVPLQLCRQKRISVSYTPDAVTPGVSELTVGFIISQLRGISETSTLMRQGKWRRVIGRRIEYCEIGIIGCGRIGTELIKLLAPFKPKTVLVNDIMDKSRQIKQLQDETGLNIRQIDLNTLIKSADVISLHLPLTRQSRNLINLNLMRAAKPDAVLINTSRGGIINEADLYQALKAGHIGQAVLDVFEEEPYSGPLLGLNNVLTTAHIGSCTQDCRRNMEFQAAEAVLHYYNTGEHLRAVPLEDYENEPAN